MISPTLIESAGIAQKVFTATDISVSQIDDEEYFIMDPSLTSVYTSTIGPNDVLVFNIGGEWIDEYWLDYLQFDLSVYGTTIKTKTTSFTEDQDAESTWTTVVPFDLPSTIPSANYVITVTGCGDADCTTDPAFVLETDTITPN